MESSFKLFMNDLKNFPLLSPEEEKDLLKRYKNNNDKEAKDILILSNIKLVLKEVNKLKNSYLEQEDLVSAGIEGLIKAIDKYDLKKETKLSTLATYWIHQSIQRTIDNQGRGIRIPVYLIEKINSLKKKEKELIGLLNREPNINELAEYCEIDEKEILKLKEISQDISSLDTPLDKDSPENTIGDIIEDTYFINPLEVCLTKDSKKEFMKVINSLDKRESQILILHYGLNGEPQKDFSEIGKKLNLTQERVRQIENKAIRKLRVPLRGNKLKECVNYG